MSQNRKKRKWGKGAGYVSLEEAIHIWVVSPGQVGEWITGGRFQVFAHPKGGKVLAKADFERVANGDGVKVAYWQAFSHEVGLRERDENKGESKKFAEAIYRRVGEYRTII